MPPAHEIIDEARTEFLRPHNQPTVFATSVPYVIPSLSRDSHSATTIEAVPRKARDDMRGRLSFAGLALFEEVPELFEGFLLEARDVHLGDVEALGDLGLRDAFVERK